MGGKRYTDEEKVDLLTRYDALKAEGKKDKQIAEEIGVGPSTLATWRHRGPGNGAANGGGEDKDTVIKELRQDNARLRKLALDALMGHIKLVKPKEL